MLKDLASSSKAKDNIHLVCSDGNDSSSNPTSVDCCNRPVVNKKTKAKVKSKQKKRSDENDYSLDHDDGTSHTGQQNQQHPLYLFFNHLNMDIEALQNEEVNRSSLYQIQLYESYLCDLMEEYPKLCMNQYPFKSFYLVNTKKKSPIYPLHMICALNMSLPCTKLCYEYNVDALKFNDTIYGTPFHYACRFQNTKRNVLQFMMNEMEQLDIVPPTSICNRRDKRTPLHLACMNPKISISVLEYIIEKTPYDIRYRKDKYGMNLLHLACSVSNPRCDIVELLLRTIYNPLLQQQSSTSFSCSKNETKIGIEYPLKCYTGCIEISKNDQSTPLHYAIMNHASVPIIKLLLQKNAKTLEIFNSKNQLPIHCVLENLSDDKVRLAIHSAPSCHHDSDKSRFIDTATNSTSSSRIRDINYHSAILRMMVAKYPHSLCIPDGQTNEIPQLTATRMKLPNVIIQILQPIRGLIHLPKSFKIN